MLALSQIQSGPVTAKQVAVESAHDPVLARVVQAIVQHVIASNAVCVDEEATQKRRQERFISTPSAFHPTTELWLFTKLWWPGLDKDIEQMIKHCATCQADAENMRRAAGLLWLIPGRAWQRVHVDFAGPVKGKMFLVVRLRTIFANKGIPEMLVSDNGPQFVVGVFDIFDRRFIGNF